MKILVTGATGFIGNQFCKYYSDEFEIIALTRTQNHNIPASCTAKFFDGSYQSLTKALEGVNAVLHLATFYTAEHKTDDVDKLVNSNISFGAMLLEAMAQNGVNKLINIGTTWQSFNSTPYRYANLYAATKQAFQELVNWYSDAKKISVINLHLNDTYGAEDTRKKIIQLLIETALNEKSLDMSGGEQEFDTTYISDVLAAISIALNTVIDSQPGSNKTYAILTGKPCSLKQLVAQIESILERKIAVNWGARNYREREVMSVPYDSYTILPGWKAKVTLNEGIKKVVSNYERD